MATKASSYSDHLDEVLVDPESTLDYLNAAIEEGIDVFLVALRDVAKARGGGFVKLAEKAQVNRENLYRILSEQGNPTAQSLDAILRALGYRLSVEAIQEAEEA
jgi:probable addiction module antidote protein